jgi:hypothetical protein
MNCLQWGWFDPGCGRPLARPLVWCRIPQNCRWTPVDAPLVARTYLSLPFHISFSSNGAQPSCLRPLSDKVQQAGLGLSLALGLPDPIGEDRLAVAVTGVHRPILWPNRCASTPLPLSLLVWNESTIEVAR